MSVSRVVSFLRNSEYRPRSAALANYEELLLHLSPRAAMFFEWVKLIRESEDRYLTGADLNRRWSDYPDLAKRYWEMTPEQRAEVLGVVTFFVHETTHHVDHLITPYGAGFHITSLDECRALPNLTARLLKNPASFSNRPLFFEPAMERPAALRAAWREMNRSTNRLDAWQHTWMTKIEEGWGQEKRLFRLLNKTLEAVTVNGFFYTVRLPGAKNYLSPVAILEARAMMHSLSWVLFTLGYNQNQEETAKDADQLKSELTFFLHTYYRSEELRPEYRLIIDLFAGLWGSATFEDLVQKMPIQNLFAVFLLIDALCWYALQSPPFQCAVHAINKSPVARLLLAMIYFEDNVNQAVSAGKKFRRESSAEMLTEMEQSQYMRQRGLLPVADSLEISLNEVQAHINQGYDDLNPFLSMHFERVLRMLEKQMSIRLTHGYNSLLGLPQSGNPSLGVGYYASNESAAHDLIMGFHTKPELSAWFAARENLLYRFAPKPEKKELLRLLSSIRG